MNGRKRGQSLKIKLSLNPDSIDAAIRQLEDCKNKLPDIADKIARELAHMGYAVAYGIMSGHVFSGEMIGNLDVVEDGPGRYILYDKSTAILFFEFGAGARYGHGHPWEGKYSYAGPGTYPGAGHWNDPKGWWFPTDDPRLIVSTTEDEHGNKKTWGHSYGNKPHMPFYNASKEMRENLLEVAKKVFQEEGG